MESLSACLHEFAERVERKAFLQMLTKGWERSVGIEVEDRQLGYVLYFHGERIERIDWQGEQPADMILSGTERNLYHLFAGEELAYLHAKKQIRTKGTIRDQLKLEALIRLSSDRVTENGKGRTSIA